MKGAIVTTKGNSVNNTLRELLVSFLEKNLFDAIIAPVRIPSGESFAYLIMNDKEALAQCEPIPPIMPIQGARVLQQLTRKGELNLRVLCIMRPCEVRASIELAKLRQVNFTNITFLSYDCPGAFPTKDYLAEQEKHTTAFQKALRTFETDGSRSTCATCVNFDYHNILTHLHIALAGMPEDRLMLVPMSPKGEEPLKTMHFDVTADTTAWNEKLAELRQRRMENRESVFSQLNSQVAGIDNLDRYFSNCINCHNCMRVCPICYCRQCFFDSRDAVRIEASNYLIRANTKGGIAFPADMMLFHLGRMFHMGLSCVGCGACEDACPMNVPVAQIFNFIADKLQHMFTYVPGKDIDEPIPVLTYTEDELHEFEDAKGIS